MLYFKSSSGIFLFIYFFFFQISSRQRSATSVGYNHDQNNSYRMEGGGEGGSPTYDYNSSGYNTRLQQPVAQRRVNSEGELLAYHRGDDNGINYNISGKRF